MINIITTTRKEYKEMKGFAINYICRQLSFAECGRYKPGCCDTCYKDNHIKCGISVYLVDEEDSDEL